MKIALRGLAFCAALVLMSLPASATSPRHQDGGGGGGGAVDLGGPASAVPEPAAALVFGVGTLIIANRLRRRNSER